MKQKPSPKQQHPSRRRPGKPKAPPDLRAELAWELSPLWRNIGAAAAFLLAIISGLTYLLPMKGTIGAFGFPLDDPWIHLTFARNLAEYGSFSYFQNQMVTSGSTSPLYTILAALLWKIAANEFFVSYTLGILFFGLSALLVWKICLRLFPREHWIAAGVTLSFLLAGKLAAIALSGMETTLFIFLLLATTYSYCTGSQVRLALFGGLLLWARPDGLILLVILALHAIYAQYLAKPEKGEARPEAIALKSYFTPGILFIILFGGYFLFNLALSGTMFPNTLAAKAKYYGGGAKTEYFKDVLRFFSSSLFGVYIPFFAAGAVQTIVSLVRRKNDIRFIFVAFAIGMVIGYRVEIPFLYQDGRYLIPTLPFFLIAGAAGMRVFFGWLLRLLPSPVIGRFGAAASVILLAAAVIVAAATWNAKRKDHYEMCRYINDRQVTTARWIAANTKPGSVIATHDIGAIGFYSGRRIADMVGLVSPEMIDYIGSLGKLEDFIRRQGATHIAVLRNWFEIVNQNPIYSTDERYPEIMEVFEYRRGITHFMPQLATSINGQAAQLLQRGRVQDALRYLDESYRMDPKSVRTLTLLGIAAAAVGDTVQSAKAFEAALGLQPDYTPVMLPFGKLRAMQKRYSEAIQLFQSALAARPDYPEAMAALQQAYKDKKADSLTALGWVRSRIEVPVR